MQVRTIDAGHIAQQKRDEERWRELQRQANATIGNTSGAVAKRIIAAVARRHGVSTDAILAPTRGRPSVVAARHEAMAWVWLTTPRNRSLIGLGRRFNRCHTTCLYALRKEGVHS
jgi:chromosomal replication initiation ATPase DnaA